jgi:hypothetical protein
MIKRCFLTKNDKSYKLVKQGDGEDGHFVAAMVVNFKML